MSDVTSSAPGRPGDHEATTGPPVLFLALAALCVVVALALAVVGGGVGTNVGGYVASSVLTVVLVGVYRRVDLTRRLHAGYRARPGAGRAVPVILLVAFVVAGVHVWALATRWAS